ncbi:hypothetical protein [Nocardioides halotolerans]|uniref:hypothetical protein n=1 Tax=Nocardioides halotolerans TaxID=433660 RepID=UPI0012FB9D63|nr:hypothetical protein [Nocardioides halotolerans]
MDDREYAEILTDAAFFVISGKGVDRFSVRALARWMKVSPAAILNDYSRGRTLAMIAGRFGQRWLAWSAGDPLFGPTPARVPLRLPEGPDEQLGIRVLGALQLLAEGERVRGNGVPASQLDRLREEELALLRQRLRDALRCCGAAPDDRHVAGIMALTRGLRETLADAESRLTPTEATEILSGYVAAAHATGCDGRLPDGEPVS